MSRALVSALGKGGQVHAAHDALREMRRLELPTPAAVYHDLVVACGVAGHPHVNPPAPLPPSLVAASGDGAFGT